MWRLSLCYDDISCMYVLYYCTYRGCASRNMHIFACILLQIDEGRDDKYKARRVSYCSNCFCACLLLYGNGGHFTLSVYVLIIDVCYNV